MTWQGAAGLADHLRPVDELVLLPGNPRHGDVGAISESLRRFGQLKPIVVDPDGVILAGNHTYQAALALGWSQVAAVSAEELAPAERAAFALADNRLSDLASYDNDALIAMLTDTLKDSDLGLAGTGYDADDLDDLIAFEQETFIPNTPGTISTVAERDAARQAAREAGMEVRTLVFLFTGPQYAWVIETLAEVEAPTHTEALLAILADLRGEAPPDA